MIHDLDTKNESTLRKLLVTKLNNSPFTNYLILIPIIEIEAWLLSDSTAIQTTFKLQKRPKKIQNTELIKDPKKYLGDIVWKMSYKRYLHTVHNAKIANNCTISSLKRCGSYKPLDKYIKSNL
ncbi:MAG: DUF4276 family protein [Candidatus Marinimicrobia bacterium]|nr:DUF4276 family protein [Candidatus Neomarinimicrobiota bacterium]